MKSSGGSGPAREIVYRLSAVYDKSRGDAALKDLASKVEGANGKIERMTAESARRQTTAREREQTRWAESLSRSMDREIRERERANQAAIRSTERLDRDLRRIDERRIRDQERAESQVHRVRERSHQATERANRAMAAEFLRIGDAALSMGRAIALSSAIGEKDMQKVLNTVLAIEVAFGAVRGGIGIAEGAGRLSRSYAKASRLAAAGGMGLGMGARMGVAGLGVAAAGGVAFAGYSAFDAARQAGQFGLGGGAAHGSFTDRVAGGIVNTGNMAGIGGMVPDIVAALAGPGAALLNWTQRGGLDRDLGAGAVDKGQQAVIARMKAAMTIDSNRAAVLGPQNQAGMGMLGLNMMRAGMGGAFSQDPFSQLSGVNRQLGLVQTERGAAQASLAGMGRGDGPESRAVAEQKVMALLSQELQLIQQQKTLWVEINRSRLQASQKETDSRRDALFQGGQSFGELSPADQQRAIFAAKRVMGGGRTTPQMRAAARMTGVPTVIELANDQARQAGLERLDRAGLTAVDRRMVQEGRAYENKLKIDIANVNEVKVTLSLEAQKLQESLEKAFKPIHKQMSESYERQLNNAIAKINRDLQAAGFAAGASQ